MFTLNLPFLLTSATRTFRTTKLMWNSIICQKKKKWSFYLIICASDVIFIIRFCYRDKVFCSLSENHSLIELFGNGLILWYYKTVSLFFLSWPIETINAFIKSKSLVFLYPPQKVHLRGLGGYDRFFKDYIDIIKRKNYKQWYRKTSKFLI